MIGGQGYFETSNLMAFIFELVIVLVVVIIAVMIVALVAVVVVAVIEVIMARMET